MLGSRVLGFASFCLGYMKGKKKEKIQHGSVIIFYRNTLYRSGLQNAFEVAHCNIKTDLVEVKRSAATGEGSVTFCKYQPIDPMSELINLNAKM